jgi:hypothetical protein
MTYAEEFKRQRYVAVNGMLDSNIVQYLESYYRQSMKGGLKHFRRDGTSLNGYGEACADLALYAFREKLETITGLPLLPGFSFVRLYRRGEKLRRHTDRGANEINCTIQIYASTPWPLGVQVDDKDILIHQECGDALIYRGLEIPHWRDEYAGDEHLQLILAYVIKDGDHKHCAYDGRGGPVFKPSGAHESIKTKLMRFGAQLKRKIKGQPPLD